MTKRKLCVFTSLLVIMCSCFYDHESHEVRILTYIHNQTQHNIHVLYDKKDENSISKCNFADKIGKFVFFQSQEE